MNKSGQFFLIAAFVLIVLILSLGEIYNYARVEKVDVSVPALAKEIKSESIQLINQGELNGLSDDELSSALNNLTSYYSINNPHHNFTTVYGRGYLALDFLQFNQGNVSKGSASITSLSPTEVSLNLNNQLHIFNLSKGYDFFIIVEKKDRNEIFVASR